MRAFSMRARTGESPPLEIATTRGLRSMIAGMMKSQRAGRSATLTSAPALLASARTAAARSSFSIATKQTAEPAKSLPSGSRASCRKFGCSRSGRKSSLSAGAKVVTRAPALMRNSARRAATTPPPTTTAGRSRSSRKIGRCRMAIRRGIAARARRGRRARGLDGGASRSQGGSSRPFGFRSKAKAKSRRPPARRRRYAASICCSASRSGSLDT